MEYSQLSNSPTKTDLSEKLILEKDALSFESAAFLRLKPVAAEIDELGPVNNVANLKWADEIKRAFGFSNER